MAETLTARQVLQSGATTGNGDAVNLQGYQRELSVYIVGSDGVTAGAVQVETAPTTDYAGTWAPLGGPISVPDNECVLAQFTGAFMAVRARISTTVADGTVTVDLVAN